MKHILFILFILLSSAALAQHWTVEAEDASNSSISWKGNEADIVASKGLTLWFDEKMTGNTVIEYEAQIVKDKRFRDQSGAPRISDLNCFWMADRMLGRQGASFPDYYALQMYYVGYGGNWNTTTRFRRYKGDDRGISNPAFRPLILREYTDPDHLLKPNHWYKIRLEQIDGRVRYFIDGECLVDFVDPEPLHSGYFGFRTTQSHARLRNFHYTSHNPDDDPVILRWIGGARSKAITPVTFGVPFSDGEVDNDDFLLLTNNGDTIAYDTWRLASWANGTSKWQAFSAVLPLNTDSCFLYKNRKSPKADTTSPLAQLPPFYLTLNNKPCQLLSVVKEQEGDIRTTIKYTYDHAILRAYHYRGSNQIKLVHTLLVDSALNHDGLSELSIRFKIGLHGPLYRRFVAFPPEQFKRKVEEREVMYSQPLIARRPINTHVMDSVSRDMINKIAKWDDFRLLQLTSNGYTIRKRATHESPWIGTREGFRNNGLVAVGDDDGFVSFALRDFWQSSPSSLTVEGVRGDTATVTLGIYAEGAETFNFAHYDTIAHTLEAAYEDVQPGMSTAWGIGRTTAITVSIDGSIEPDAQLVCTPEYFHRKRAFGIWSLPTVENPRDSLIEATIDSLMEFYNDEIHRNYWYGFFNYGDVMHAYDGDHREWRYDVGGYAWDNTELGTPAMFWYQFLRTGNKLVYRMAEAMTRHCSEIDTYHFGPHAGLGSRHNVLHWGCGAKEARISQAWWNRFYYYLTADDRIADIMREVQDADTLLYTLDPMRLAQLREQYPCTAPARLRIGPDWLAYVSNWFTAWEKDPVNNRYYYDKIITGMNSIADFRNGFFQGPKALGYYPDTGLITCESDSDVVNTNHLLAIMGGFELLNEIEGSVNHPRFFAKWLDHNRKYKKWANRISHNNFLIPRLTAYAAWRLGDNRLGQEAWDDLLNHVPRPNLRQLFWTNDAATWTVDAIFLKEVLR